MNDRYRKDLERGVKYVTLRIDEQELREVDDKARAKDQSRSAFLRDCITWGVQNCERD